MLVGLFFDRQGEVATPFAVASFTVPTPGFDAFWGDGALSGLRSGRRFARPFFKGLHAPTLVAQAARTWWASGVETVAGNEPDNPLEAYRSTPAQFADWFERVCLAAPGAPIWYPGPSGRDRNLDALRDPRVQAVIRTRAAGVAVHLYGTRAEIRAQLRLLRAVLGPDVRLGVPELNPGWGRLPQEYGGSLSFWCMHHLPGVLDDLREVGVEWVTYFADRWTQDDPGVGERENLSAAGSMVPSTLRTWASGGVRGERLEPLFPPTKELSVIRGIDISNNNGLVDLAKVKAADYQFVAIKASQDTADGGFRDAFFVRNWVRAGELELGRIAYHMTDPRHASPAESVTLVEEMVNRVGGLRDGDAVAIDVELGQTDLVWLAEVLDLASRTFGHLVWKYSGDWYTSQEGLENAGIARYPSWFVGRPGDPEQVGWSPVKMWQQTLPAGSVPGVVGEVDVNTFPGTIEELRALGKPAQAVDVEALERDLWGPGWRLAASADQRGRADLATALRDAVVNDKRAAGVE